MKGLIFFTAILAGLSAPALSTNIIFMLMDDVSNTQPRNDRCALLGAAIYTDCDEGHDLYCNNNKWFLANLPALKLYS